MKSFTFVATICFFIVGQSYSKNLAEDIMSTNTESNDIDELLLRVEKTSFFHRVLFALYTKKNPIKYQELKINDVRTLNSSNYNTSWETKVLIHGWKSSINEPVVSAMKDNFLSTGKNYNIIAVDWSLIAIFGTYYFAFKQVKPTGETLGQLLDFLVKKGTSVKNIHIIGHSLGAHVAGYASSSMKAGKVPRITGLDPALPLFQDVDISNRLDATDADFVDCIHTSIGLFGIIQPDCTADFYPNGGTCPQPGCSFLSNFETCLLAGSCSHQRSHEYFTESILRGHQFVAQNCDSMYFRNGECQNKGALMGFPANSSFQGVFYLETNSKYPYAKEVDNFSSDTVQL